MKVEMLDGIEGGGGRRRLPICYSSWDNPGDVYRRVLLLSSHNIEPKSFLSLREFHNPEVNRKSLLCSKPITNKTTLIDFITNFIFN